MEVIERESLDVLFDVLRRQGFSVVGPTVAGRPSFTTRCLRSMICPLAGPTAGRRHLPTRTPRRRGAVRICRRPAFLEALPAPTVTALARARRNGGGLEIRGPEEPAPYAFLGVRACELHAIATQDRVLMGAHTSTRTTGPARRPYRRGQLRQAGGHLLLRVDGHRARCDSGFDLALTEVIGVVTTSWSRLAATGVEVFARDSQPAAAEEDDAGGQGRAEPRATAQHGP